MANTPEMTAAIKAVAKKLSEMPNDEFFALLESNKCDCGDDPSCACAVLRYAVITPE